MIAGARHTGRRMPSLYELVGGQEWFTQLVDRFYRDVEQDPVLRPLYPDDLSEPKRLLAAFLAQYWGGPRAYDEERGHPRLRMRHAPFPIGDAEAQAWLRHMTAAIQASDAPPEAEAALLDYVSNAAFALRNTTQ